MTMNQKKALYAFGCPEREAIAREMNAPTADRCYRCMFFNLRLEMEAYLRYEKAFERIVSGCPEEDCEDCMEYNEEWEDEGYDPDEV